MQENLDFFGDVYASRGEAEQRKRGLFELCGLDGREDSVGQPLGRAQAAPRARLRAHPRAEDPLPRRADRRRRPGGAPQLWDLLFRLAQQGTTLFVTTHYMDEAERCTKAAYVYFGQLLVSGDPNSMKLEEIATTNRRLEILCQPLMPALGVLRDAPFVDDVSVFGQALHIRVKDLPPEPVTQDGFASFAASARRAMVMDLLRKRLSPAASRCSPFTRSTRASRTSS